MFAANEGENPPQNACCILLYLEPDTVFLALGAAYMYLLTTKH